jgi:Calcineurin-like phosphoesterase
VGTANVPVLIHAGDFGLWRGPAGSLYVRHVNAACEDAGVSILVVPGNHEDWGRLDALWASPRRRGAGGQPRPIYVTENIAFLPRPWRWAMGGRTFVALGGAASLDNHRRTEGKSWWPSEIVSPDQVAATVAGGIGDILVTHEAPSDARFQTEGVREALRTNPLDWPDDALAKSALSRQRIQQAADAVQPRLWVHGHMHTPGECQTDSAGWGHQRPCGRWAPIINGTTCVICTWRVSTTNPSPESTRIRTRPCFRLVDTRARSPLGSGPTICVTGPTKREQVLDVAFVCRDDAIAFRSAPRMERWASRRRRP